MAVQLSLLDVLGTACQFLAKLLWELNTNAPAQIRHEFPLSPIVSADPDDSAKAQEALKSATSDGEGGVSATTKTYYDKANFCSSFKA